MGGRRGGEGDDRGEVVAAAQQVELNACEEGEEGEGVEERKSSSYGCASQSPSHVSSDGTHS